MTWQFWVALACDVVVIVAWWRRGLILVELDGAIPNLLQERRTLLQENADLRTRLTEMEARTR